MDCEDRRTVKVGQRLDKNLPPALVVPICLAGFLKTRPQAHPEFGGRSIREGDDEYLLQGVHVPL